MMRFATADTAIDVASLRAELHNPDHGGFCAFEGWVRNRNEGRAVGGLEYEIYHELAQVEGERIMAEARARFGTVDAVGMHRDGMLRTGELAVWVGVSSAHRDEAFRACRFIIDQIKHRLPVWKKEHYLEGDTAWVACAHLAADGDHAHHDHDAPAAFAPDFSRQTRLPGVGADGQARLAAARVLVIGAGGLGCPALQYLVGAGVGQVGIVDPDRVEASNLHRQTLYAGADIGRLKVEAAAERLRRINPATRFELGPLALEPAEAPALFGRFDLVLDCTDDMRSRFASSDAAMLSGRPLILASVHQYEGQLQVIDPRRGDGCLRCLWPAEPVAAGSCEQSGVLGPVPGVLGAMQANEALKTLLGLPGQAPDILLLVDLLDNRTDRLRIDTGRGCAARGGCQAVAQRNRGTQDAPLDLHFPTLDAARAAGFRLVDLRNADERALRPIPGSAAWVPLPVLMQRSGELPTGAPLLLVCASGRRSAHGAQALRDAGRRDVFSLAGGLGALDRADARS